MASKSNTGVPMYGDGASPGKIFIGGLPKDTTYTTFNNHFGKYGEIIDSVIMKDRFTGIPRGFGFITYGDPSVVDRVIEDTHIINGKQVEIKRTIPKGMGQPKDFKTKKIFVGGIPSTVSEDELKSFFSTFGEVIEHQILRDHETNRSRGFGFIVFDREEVVDHLLSKGNMLDFADTQVEIKKAEPKKPSSLPPAPPYRSNPRARNFGDGYGPRGDPYSGFDDEFGPSSYRNPGGPAGRFGGYNSGYAAGADFGPYAGFRNNSVGGYRGDSSMLYGSRFGSYGERHNGAGGYGPGGSDGYGRGDGYWGYGDYDYGNGYDPSSGAGYAGPDPFYGRGGYSGNVGNSRYHPYAR